MLSLGILYVKTFFQGRKIFLVFTFVFLSFPCTTFEKIISIALCENNFSRDIFFCFSSFFLISFLCKAIVTIFWIIFCKNGLFQNNCTFLNFKSSFLTSFLCTTPETTLRMFSNQNNLLKKILIFKFHFFKSFFCKPIVAVFRNTLCKTMFHGRIRFFYFSRLEFFNFSCVLLLKPSLV